MKFGPTQPARDRYDFTAADKLVDFAQAHNMKVRGHTFVWHQMMPRWITASTFSADEVAEILRDHIRARLSGARSSAPTILTRPSAGRAKPTPK